MIQLTYAVELEATGLLTADGFTACVADDVADLTAVSAGGFKVDIDFGPSGMLCSGNQVSYDGSNPLLKTLGGTQLSAFANFPIT